MKRSIALSGIALLLLAAAPAASGQEAANPRDDEAEVQGVAATLSADCLDAEAGDAAAAEACMTPSNVTVEPGITMVAIEFTNEADADLCITARGAAAGAGADPSGADGADAADAEACDERRPDVRADDDQAGDLNIVCDSTYRSPMPPAAGEDDAGGADNGTDAEFNDSQALPLLVPAGDVRTLCLDVGAGMENVTVLLARGNVPIATVRAPDAADLPPDEDDADPIGDDARLDDEGAQESAGDEQTPAAGVLAALATLGLAAVALRRRS